MRKALIALIALSTTAVSATPRTLPASEATKKCMEECRRQREACGGDTKAECRSRFATCAAKCE